MARKWQIQIRVRKNHDQYETNEKSSRHLLFLKYDLLLQQHSLGSFFSYILEKNDPILLTYSFYRKKNTFSEYFQVGFYSHCLPSAVNSEASWLYDLLLLFHIWTVQYHFSIHMAQMFYLILLKIIRTYFSISSTLNDN